MEAEGRQNHIDALRGLAVSLMVMVHAAATWNPFSTTQITPLAYVVSGLGGLAAPLFVTLLGWGLMKSKLTPHQRWARGLFLLACQFLVNISAPHLFEPFTPGVLSLLGLLIISEPLWSWPLRTSKHSTRSFAAMSLACFTMIFVFPEIQGDGQWGSRTQSNSINMVAQHLIFTGTYPLFPWFLFAVLGGLICRLKDEEHKTFFAGMLTSGLIFTGLTFAWALRFNQIWALPSGNALLTFFPANAPFLIAAMTGTLILWAVARQSLGKSVLLARAGRCSLSIYVAHFLPFAVLHNIDQTYGWSLTLSTLVVVCYTMLWLIIGAYWYSKAPKTTLETLMRTIEGRQPRLPSRPGPERLDRD